MISTSTFFSLSDFLKLNFTQRSQILHKNGLLLDSDVYKGERVNLFYLGNFFAEETLNSITWELKDVIPYKTGFRLETYQHLNRRRPQENLRIIG
jgi:hypothetical protein